MTEQATSKTARNLKIAAVIIAAAILVVIIAQNTAQVETRILFATITMPRALLLAAVLVLGFGLGFVMGRRGRGG